MLYPVLQDPLHPIVSSLFDRPRGASIGQMLFGAGEQGAWYDPSDLSTLFQDAAGSTPVTAVEQTVGRILDKSGRGNHATQATTTKRPVYSRRYNMLTKTEQFEDVVWTKINSTISANTIVAPDGFSTADRLVEDIGATGNKNVYTTTVLAPGTVYRMRVWVKPDSRTKVYVTAGSTTPWGGGYHRGVYVNCVTGAVFKQDAGATATTQVGSDGWVFIDVTFPVTTTGGPCSPAIRLCDEAGSFSYTGDGSGLYIWGASLTPAIDAHLPYQRVNTATDYDADPAKFPAYLRFDGVDDALQTGNIDFTSTDKMAVWVGMTNLSDATVAELVGLSSNPTLTGGRFMIRSTFAAGSVGRTWHTTGVSTGTIASFTGVSTPGTDILTGVSDLAAPLVVARRDGIVTQTQTANLGGGTFSNNPLYIGSRAGTSQIFNGRLYSLIVRGAQTPLSQIEAAERYIKTKMRMP